MSTEEYQRIYQTTHEDNPKYRRSTRNHPQRITVTWPPVQYKNKNNPATLPTYLSITINHQLQSTILPSIQEVLHLAAQRQNNKAAGGTATSRLTPSTTSWCLEPANRPPPHMNMPCAQNPTQPSRVPVGGREKAYHIDGGSGLRVFGSPRREMGEQRIETKRQK